jgi:hypothetical protein
MRASAARRSLDEGRARPGTEGGHVPRIRITRLQVNGNPVEYLVLEDAASLTKRLTAAMKPPGKPVQLNLVDSSGKPAGTLVLNGAHIREVVIDGVPPMDTSGPKKARG